MKRIFYNRTALFLVMVMLAWACSKPNPVDPTPNPPNPNPPTTPVEIDPSTGKPTPTLTTATGECNIIKIAQKNGSGGDNAYEIKRDVSLNPTSISSYDSLLKKVDYNITVQKVGDSIALSTGEYFLLDASTKQVKYFSTRSDLQDPNSDKQLFQYSYDANGYLVKKLQFINGATVADYETNYTYSGGVLTTCTVLAGSKKTVLLQSSLDYDLTVTKKAWMYLFTDFFEGYHYLQTFPFGKKSTNPVKSITTNIYDINDGTILDTWTTTFSGYVYSQDGFILQTSAKGDLQQGLGLLFGTTKFEYQCTK